MKLPRLLLGGLVALTTSACTKESDLIPSSGELDFNRPLAIGNSYTAGFSNGGLYRTAQQFSYPNLLALQAQKAGAMKGTFGQPLFSEVEGNGTGFLYWEKTDTEGRPLLGLVQNNLGIRSYNPILYTKFIGKNENLGVPNICVADVTQSTFGRANAFYERLLPESGTAKTYLQMVEDYTPTFFTCWLGDNDVMLYATSGGTKGITPVGIFSENFRKLMSTLAKNQAKGIVMTIPDMTQIAPFFTNRKASAMGGVLKSPIYIRTGKGKVRPATDADLILFSADSVGVANRSGLPKGYLFAYPLNNEDVLDEEEVQKVRENIAAFNDIIITEAQAQKFTVWGVHEYLLKLKGGINQNGLRTDASYPLGGFYSLDGQHFTARGNALITNELLKVMNTQFKSKITVLDVSKYEGVVKP